MRYRSGLALLACCLGLYVLPAPAAADCARLLEAVGRDHVADAPDRFETPEAGTTQVYGCPVGQLYQLAYDVGALRRATPVADRDQLIGTWVSDNHLTMVAGLTLPSFEYLVIAPGDAPDTILLEQRVLRYLDPAEMFADDLSPLGGSEVPRGGRRPLLGELAARLTGEGQLSPIRARYFDLPLDTDRRTDLMMKSEHLSLYHAVRPLEVATDGQSLVFRFMDRLSPGGERMMTFRKRDPGTLTTAYGLAAVGEISMSHVPCFLEMIEARPPVFLDALSGVGFDELDAAMGQSVELREARERLMEVLRRDTLSDAERTAGQEEMLAMIDRLQDLNQSDAMQVLAAQAASDAPFGCPRVW